MRVRPEAWRAAYALVAHPTERELEPYVDELARMIERSLRSRDRLLRHPELLTPPEWRGLISSASRETSLAMMTNLNAASLRHRKGLEQRPTL
jgi:hypothetical protein